MRARSKHTAAVQTRRKTAPTNADPPFQQSPLPAWIYDAQTLQFLDVNLAVRKACGYSKAEFLKMRLPELAEEQATNGGPNGTAGKERSSLIKVLGKDGTTLNFEASVQDIEYDGHPARLARLTKADEHAKPDKCLTAVLEGSPDPMAIVDARGRITLVNQPLERRFGYSRDELIGKPVEILLAGEFHSKHRTLRAEFFSDPRPLSMGPNLPFRARAKDGSQFSVEMTLSLLEAEQGLLVLATIRDASEQERTAQPLNQAEGGYRDLVDNSQVLMCTHDLEGNLLSINPWAARVLGYEAKDLIGRNIETGLGPESRPGFRGYLLHMRRRGFADGIMHVMTATGQTRIWEFHNTLRTDGVAKPIVRATAFDITERREAEEALRESEAGYKLLFEAAPMGVALTDPAGNLLAFNDALLEPGGYSREDLLRLGNISSLYADPTYTADIQALLDKRGRLTKYELKLKRKDGSLFDALLTMTKLEIQGKQRLQAIVEDISQRRAAEEALRKSELLYRDLFNNAVEGMFRTTPEGRLVSANPALIRMLGYENESELLSLSVSELYVDPERRVYTQDKILESGELRDFEIHLRRRDGETLIALENSRAVRDAKGNVVLYEGTLTDITDRKRIEEALRVSEAELRSLFDAVPDLVLVLDKGGRYLRIAPGHEGILFAPPQELLGRTLHEVFSDPKADEFVGYIRAALRTGKTVHLEYPLLVGSDIKWFSAAVAPLTSESVVWVARDITPQKQTEEQVQRRLLELEALYESGLALGKTLDPSEISRKVIEVLSNRLHWHYAAVHVRRGDSEEAELLAFSDASGYGTARKAPSSARDAVINVGEGMAGWVMRHGRMINSANLSQDPRYAETFPNMQSGLYVPIWAGGRVLGCISVESHQPEAFTEADERLLTTLGSQAAAALENARLFSETRQRVSESLALHEFTRDLTAQFDLVNLLKALAERVSSLLKVPGGTVYLYDENRQDLEIVMTTEEGLAVGTRLAQGQGMAGKVAETRQPLVVDDYQTWEGRPAQYLDKTWAAVVQVPMLYRGELIGVLAAYDYHMQEEGSAAQPRKFTEEDVRLLSLFAASAGGAIYSARLFDAERLRREEAETLRSEAVRAAERLSVLHGATREIARISQSAEDVYASIHQAAARLLDFEAFTIALVDERLKRIDGVYLIDEGVRIPPFDIPVGQSLTSHVIEAGETLLIKDIEAADLHRVHFGTAHHVRSILAVPLRVGGQVIGILSAQSYEADRYTAEDQVLLEMLAAHAAIAIENARLYQQALRSAERQAVLHRVSQTLTQISQDPRRLYAAIHAGAAELMVADVFTIALLDENAKELEGVYAVDRGKYWPGERLPVGSGYSGWVLEHNQTLLLADAHASTVVHRIALPEGGDTRSVLMVPLQVGEKVIGAMSVQSYQENQYTDEDQTILEMLGSQAGIAIQNARLFAETSRRAEEFRTLYETTAAMTMHQDMSSLVEMTVKRATELLHASGGGVYLYDAKEDELVSAAWYGVELALNIRIKPGQGAAGRVAQTGEPLLIEDYAKWEGHAAQYEGVPFRAVLEVPMVYSGELIGVLCVHEYGKQGTRKFTEADGRLLSLFATQAAGAISNARLLEDTRRRLHELEALAKVGEALAGTLELEPLLENILRTARQAIPAAEKGSILLRGESDPGHLHMRAQVGYGESRLREVPFEDSKGYAGRAFHEKRPMLIRDAVAEFEIPFGQQFDEVNAVQSAIVAPLIVKDEAIGAIALDNASRTSAFEEADLRLLQLFASSAAVVIENARLFGETRRRAQEFEVLYEATRDLSTNQQDLPSLLAALADKAARLMGSHGSGIYLYDAAHKELELAIVSTGEAGAGTHIQLGEGAAGRVAETQTPLLIDDYDAWEGRREILDGSRYRALLQVPMAYGGELIGVVDAYEYGDSERKFNEGDVKLLSLFASQAAAAVHSARLFEETRKKAAQFASLYETARDLSGQQNVNQLLEIIVERASKLLNAPVSGVYLYDNARNDLYVAVNKGLPSSLGVRVSIGEGVAGQVAKARQPMIIDDHLTWEGRTEQYEDFPMRSVLEVPMLYSGELIGVLTVNEIGESERKFNRDDADLLSLFASYAAGAVHTARLFEQISRRASEFEALYQTAADLSAQTDLQTLLNTVIQRARDLMSAAGSDVYLWDMDVQALTLAAANDPNRRLGSRLALGEGLSGCVAQGKRPLIVSNYQEWEGRGAQGGGLPLASAIGVPMLYGGQLVGVLTAYNRGDGGPDNLRGRFTAQDANLLELLANSAAGAVYVARLLEQTRRRVEQLSALHAVDTAIGSTTDLRVSLQAVLESVIRQLGVDAADVLLLNPSTLLLQYSAGSGFFTSEINRTTVSIGEARAGKAALERRIIHIPDLTAEKAGFARPNLVAAERFKAYVAVPLIAKGELKGVLEVFQRAPLELEEERKSLLEVLAGQAALAIDSAQLFEGLEKANLELTMAYDATIEGWSQALELRDEETQGHSSRVLELSLRLAAAVGLPDSQMREIRRGVLLHDIGKMGIPDSILHKPGPLTPEEWEIMRLHPQYAFDMLAPIVYLRNSLDIPYAHHEKWDGNGYPRGLKAETIPLAARVFAVVDVYDALTSDRPYRKAWSEAQALEYITEQSGKHFDPQIVDAFLKLISK